MKKKILAVVLAVVLLASGTVSFANPAPQGDANCDGIVNAADAAAILRHLVELKKLTEQGYKNADFNLDGQVNAADAACILRYLVELYEPPTFPYRGPKMSLANFPILNGSTATIPLAVALMQHATGCLRTYAENSISFSTTDYSYYYLQNGWSDLLLVYEAADAVKDEIDFDKTFDLKPIGKDGLVFIVNSDNPVNSLTTSQLQGIYSGVITNWAEVGGDDKEIVPFQRPDLSGSQTMMQKLVMGDVPLMEAPSDYYMHDMSDLINKVASYYDNGSNALGYSVYYYAQNMYALPGLKFIAVDGVLPNEMSIATGAYPYINEFFGVLPKENPNPNAKLLLDWLLTDNGQEFIASCGYVPINPDILPTPLLPPEPSDHDLWDPDYYAVLPWDGSLRVVYDSRLRKVGAFTTRGLGWSPLGSRMYTAEELAECVLFENGKQRDLDSPRAGLFTYRYEHGFYRYDPLAGKLYMYDKTFKLRYTVNQEAGLAAGYKNGIFSRGYTPTVWAMGEYDWIGEFAPEIWTSWDEEDVDEIELLFPAQTVFPKQIRKTDGTVVSSPLLTLDFYDLLGENYFIDVTDLGDWEYIHHIYDLSGNRLVEDVRPVSSRYYAKDGWLFDANLNAVSPLISAFHPWDGGEFVNGVVYDIGGVPSSGEVTWGDWGSFIQGRESGVLYAKRNGQIASFALSGTEAYLWDYNDSFAVIRYPAQDRCEVHFRKINRVDKLEWLPYGDYPIELGGNYYIYNGGYEVGKYCVDENGRKYQVLFDEIYPLAVNNMILIWEEWSNVGIADLNGNWLVRAPLY